MKRALVTGIVMALLSGTLQAAVWQEDFGAGRPGWTGATVTPEAGKAGPGLRLAAPGAEPAWATSPELPGPPGDWQVLALEARHAQGAAARLALGLVPPGGGAPREVWSSALPADGKWHRYELVLSPPPGAVWRLALACAGAGEWHVDNLSLGDPSKWLRAPDPLPADLGEAKYPESLPVDWQPQGTLDARTRTVADRTELVLNVGGVTVSLPSQAEIARGRREGPVAFFSNPGTGDATVSVTTQGPPGLLMPIYALPIRPGGTTAFTLPLPVATTGEYWLKLTFGCEPQTASAPLRVKVTRSYPALGVSLPAGEALPAELASWPLAFRLTALGADEAGNPTVPAAGATGAPLEECLRFLCPTFEQLAQGGNLLALRDRARALLTERKPALVQVAWDPVSDPSAAELVELHREVRTELTALSPGSGVVSPSWALQATPQGAQPPARMREAFAQGLGQCVDSVAVAWEEALAGAVLMERVDGDNPATACGSWQTMAGQYELGAMREWLNGVGASLPLLLDLTRRSPQARPGAESLLLARLLLDAAWQGGTGTLLAPESARAGGGSTARVVGELARELTAVEPLYLPPSPEGYCTRGTGSALTGWTFLRGHEGIVFLANNTSDVQEVELALRSTPVQMQVLRLSAFEQPVTRQIQGAFRFSAEAQARHTEAIYARLAPGDVVGLSLLLLEPHEGWLGAIRPMPPDPNAGTQERPNIFRDNPWFRGKRGGPMQF